MTNAQVRITREIVFDEAADVSWLEGDRCDNDEDRAADAARLADFNDGRWHMLGMLESLKTFEVVP